MRKHLQKCRVQSILSPVNSHVEVLIPIALESNGMGDRAFKEVKGKIRSYEWALT